MSYGPRKTRPMLDRFWEKVDRRSDEDCWEWTAYRLPNGYGWFGIGGNGVSVLAHRLAYELSVGPIPEGLQIDHLCRNRACVNPAHLEPVTLKVNIFRGISPSARNARKTHCNRGHEFTAGNTYRYVLKDGRPYRMCRTCSIDSNRRRRYVANESGGAA